jgi:histidinol-phosphatase (PHP family)
VIDYHLHLWSHAERDRPVVLEELAAFVERAAAQGVREIALTEHFYRFRQARSAVAGFFRRYPDSPVRAAMERYWEENSQADLDAYVECVLEAKREGLAVVLGLEVDYYEGAMDRVGELLAGYPFDVLLGSVHWVDAWAFDHLSDPVMMAEWERVGVEPAWEAYTRSLEELAATRAVDVLAHPDLIKVAGHRPSVPAEYEARMAEAAAASGLAAEVSSAGLRKPVGELYPSPSLLARFVAAGVPLTTASDSHGLGDVADRAPLIRQTLKAAGVQELAGFRARRRVQHALAD